MNLPRVNQPDRYIGLYVFDFGEHANVGYTAGEIATLLAQAEFSDGKAYEICRVDEDGLFFLRGLLGQSWQAEEVMAFLRGDAAKAQLDYQAIISLAESDPLNCAAELVLTEVYEFQLSHVTAIIYKSANANIVTQWLSRVGFDGGDEVMCGAEVRSQVMSEHNIRIANQLLTVISTYLDRPLPELVERIEQRVQR